MVGYLLQASIGAGIFLNTYINTNILKEFTNNNFRFVFEIASSL
jgi:hypothetical protein